MLGLVKLFNVVAGLLLVFGTVTLVWLMATRGPSGGGDPPALRPTTLAQGERLLGVAAYADGLALLVARADGRREVRYLDAQGGVAPLVAEAP